MEKFKPHLAGKVDFAKWPTDTDFMLGSVKVDALRAVNVNGEILSRTLKYFPNKRVQELFSRPEFKFFDGELVVGEPNSPNVYLDSFSGIMSQDGEPAVTWCVFDYFKYPNDAFGNRYQALQDALHELPDELRNLTQLVIQEPLHAPDQVLQFEATSLENGWEGVMLRHPNRPYKFGRSSNSPKDSALLKLKVMESSEAVIIGFECEYENTNEATLDERGYTKRSTHKAGKVPKDTLGKILVKDVVSGVEFAIGVFRGLTKEDLKNLWDNRENLHGRVVTYDYFGIGAYNSVRHPVFKGFREGIDYGEIL